MDDQRVGRIMRALRRRLGWRQCDLAAKAACSQRTVSRAELGHLPTVPILRRLLAALDAWLAFEVRWRAGALDRLLDEGHATLVGIVSDLLGALGWEVHVEVSYSEYGERGSVDVLAFWPPLGILLVIEVKTDLAGVEAVLRKLDEKVRLAPTVALDRFGWQAQHVAWLLVMPESSTLRRRVERQAAVLRRAFPARGADVRRWLRQPAGGIAGLVFLSPSRGKTAIQRCGGPERVRRPNSSSSSQRVAA
jgi:transcriptional regulator with XRE-family HTH domain